MTESSFCIICKISQTDFRRCYQTVWLSWIFGCFRKHRRITPCTLQIRPTKSLLPIPIAERIRTGNDAKAVVVVTIRGRVPVTIGRAAIVTVVVPRTATKDTL